MSTKTFLSAYALAALVFLALDAVWLGTMGPRLYRPLLGPLLAEQVVWPAAALFYVLYLVGVVAFAVRPGLLAGSALHALGWGALFGLLAYATYDLTNQATLKGWPWIVTAIDLAWGATVTAVSAAAATAALLRLAPR